MIQGPQVCGKSLLFFSSSQEATECLLIINLEKAQLAANHRKRITVTEKDLLLIQRVQI